MPARYVTRLIGVAAIAATMACGPHDELSSGRRDLSAAASADKTPSRPRIVVLGDSLTAGLEARPNFGREYTARFHQVYPALARQFHVALVPFLLDHVAGSETLNQRDGIHPTVEGARIVADTVWRVLEPIVERKSSRD